MTLIIRITGFSISKISLILFKKAKSAGKIGSSLYLIFKTVAIVKTRFITKVNANAYQNLLINKITNIKNAMITITFKKTCACL